ncbi:hypothetical protein Goklo_025476 [Gossypium klotzschianum]|uniref:Uncharacterized protein n=1 Tax=Gossypium klotzschianum TaxID=34286 RepID=A0A7J8WCA7_9ROSI|nr:hypothetical protein [Gossypium klotzschianum]
MTFTEDKTNQVVGKHKTSLNFQGHEAWAVGKGMATEKVNREAMYRRDKVEILIENDGTKSIDNATEGRDGELDLSLEIAKGKGKMDEGASDSSSLTDKRMKRAPKECGIRARSKHKKIKGYSGEGDDEGPVQSVRRKLADGASPFKAVASDQPNPEPWKSYVGTAMGLGTL